MKTTRRTSADWRVMPWKNGGGITREMAIFPEGATLGAGDFLWRVSSADVSTGGPFSLFPEHDRLLFLLSGGGVILSGEGREVRLDRPLKGHRFRGDTPYGCTLLNGPVTDFNVIWRRDVLNCTYRIVYPGEEEALCLEGETSLLFSPLGGCEGGGYPLGKLDLMIVDDYGSNTSVRLQGEGTPLLLFTLDKI